MFKNPEESRKKKTENQKSEKIIKISDLKLTVSIITLNIND